MDRATSQGERFSATVLRGLEGFGAHSRIHTAKILRLSEDLPIVIEIVDTSEKIEAFLPLIDAAIKEDKASLLKIFAYNLLLIS